MKLLVNYCGKIGYEEGMSNQDYFTKMKEACAKLGISSCQFVHFGRCAGSVKVELEELEVYDIDDLGNWNVHFWQNFYLVKLPMKAMCEVAGYSKNMEAYYTTCCNLHIEPEVLAMFFPWTEEQMSKVKTYSDPLPKTAAFLKMIVRLKPVFL